MIQFASMFTNPILIKVFDAWRRYVIISRFEREERMRSTYRSLRN